MLDRLPVELLEHILRFAAPLDYWDEDKPDRRLPLRTCCLVNSKLLRVAQPMLAEVVAVRREEDAEVVKPGDEGAVKGAMVRLLAIDGQHDGVVELSIARVHQLLELCPNVRDVRLSSFEDLDLTLLANLPKLRHLVVSYSTFLSSDYWLPPPTSPPTSHPNPLLKPELHTQLVALSFCKSDVQRIPSIVGTSQVPVLVAALAPEINEILSLNTSALHHIRLHDWVMEGMVYSGTTDSKDFALDLHTLRDNLSLTRTVRTLELPQCFHPGECDDEDLELELDELMRVCSRQGIQVMWTGALGWVWGSPFSANFWHWAREDTARRASEAAQQ
ncbi:hypothetical protein JCM10213v2_003252 [Rhodosporidiobolus nylandii]